MQYRKAHYQLDSALDSALDSVRRFCLQCLIIFLAQPVGGLAQPQPLSGWDLSWYDEFNDSSLDQSKWTPIYSTHPTNNSLHAYLPDQVTVSDGNLLLTSENRSFQHLPYRSGQVISKSAQRFGRWEVRGKLPTSRGMWPAIWLLPDVQAHPWPSGGEIDIMENRGDQPHLTSSAFHYGSNPPYQHSFVYGEQRSIQAGNLVDYHDNFHTYAVEWDTDQLRFFVDDVHYYTVHDSDVGGFISSATATMKTIINTAIGGDFLGDPDGTTVWPQQFLVDYVHVYTKSAQPEVLTFENGSFDQDGGSLASWSTFGNKFPNVRSDIEAIRTGAGSLKLFGQFNNATNCSGVAQGITVNAGEQLRTVASALIRSPDSIAGTQNFVDMKIEYYNKPHGRYGTGEHIGSDVVRLVDGTSSEDVWLQQELQSTVPAGAVEARVAFVFAQPADQAGAVHVDDVFFGRKGDATLTWNESGGGDWSAGQWVGGPYPQPTEFDNAVVNDHRVIVTGDQTAHETTVVGGVLQMAGQLASHLTVDVRGAIAGTGTIDGHLTLAGAHRIAAVGGIAVTGDIQLTDDATILVDDGYAQTRGTNTGDFLLLSGDSLSGQFGIPAGAGTDSHLGDGFFLHHATYTASQLTIDIYAALLGDANGDGVVDTSDFNIWNSNKFKPGTDWTTGDFDGNGTTDASDFNIWNAHKFSSAMALVPEPSAAAQSVIMLLTLLASLVSPKMSGVCSRRPKSRS